MKLKQTIGLRLFGLKNIPLLFVSSPSVIHIDDDYCVAKIPLNYWTKNHLGSMYFGALAMGGDLAGGLMAMDLIQKSGKKINLIFKDFHADCLMRAEGDVHFTCHDGKKIKDLVAKAIKTGERVNTPLHIVATTPKQTGDQPVAKFDLTLSLKMAASKKDQTRLTTKTKSPNR